MSECIVVNSQGTDTIIEGSAEEIVTWLEKNPSEDQRYVYVKRTSDILSESEFLDLAS